MQDLIKVDFDTETVSARDLHKEVGSTERFSTWFDRQLQFGFEVGSDYSNPLKVLRVQIEGEREVSREVKDYNLTIDMAKQICMVQKNEKAKEVRRYLIDLEKAWNTPELVMARGLKAAQNMIADQSKLIEQMKPKAVFADAVTSSKSSILVRDLAKLISQNGAKIGEQRLYKWLRDNGYIFKTSTMPMQKYIEQGLFEVSEFAISKPDGNIITKFTTRVTGKGQAYFIKKFLGVDMDDDN